MVVATDPKATPAHYEGDLSSLWRLDTLEPLQRLSWWWWWWLVLLPDPRHPGRTQQLMVLWSTKDTERIWVSGHDWHAGGRTRVDEHGGITFPGMVASWWYDGERMHEPLVLREARFCALDSAHPLWPQKGGAGTGDPAAAGAAGGGGAVLPLLSDDLSMGLADDRSHFWLTLEADEAAVANGAPARFDLRMTPWNRAISGVEYSHNEFSLGMGYDILRIHGSECTGEIGGEPVTGTAYFQKVCVQAPSIPWFWGMLHFSDGSYLDWFLPHASFTLTAKDDRPWKARDFARLPLKGQCQWKDAGRQRTEQFARCEVELLEVVPGEGVPEFDEDGNPLPCFHVRVWNGRTQIGLLARAVARAHWTFDQPTRACMTSHFTYNEYPLEIDSITVLDERGVRTLEDWEWIHGNAEHSWGLLH